MRHRCYTDDCDYCQHQAETAAANHEPDYDTSAAADQYERQFDQ